MKVIIVSSCSFSLVNFRGKLIENLVSQGYEVIAVHPFNSDKDSIKSKLSKINVQSINIPVINNIISPINDFYLLAKLVYIFYITKPNLIISYTIKPVIYSGLALNILRIFFKKKINFFPMITGLGNTFNQDREIISIKFFMKKLIINLYRVALKSAKTTIFQNSQDIELFIKSRILNAKQNVKLVNGSGVDLTDFPFTKIPKEQIFLFAARLIPEKGINDFISAAKLVKKKYPSAKFLVAGPLPTNMPKDYLLKLNKLLSEGTVNYLGYIKPIQNAIKICRYFVLPTFYREGIPRVLLEALSMGRPIITTDTPGCSKTVLHGKNGYFVKVRSPLDLSEKMIMLIEKNNESILKMSKISNQLAKDNFDVTNINSELLKVFAFK